MFKYVENSISNKKEKFNLGKLNSSHICNSQSVNEIKDQDY